jgi:class 3 adenylate cyclase
MGEPIARLTCPECQTPAPAGARFCPSCGRRLGGDRVRQYVPPEVIAKLEATRRSSPAGGLEAERRVITILFCDVKGSTAIAERLDPEEWADVMASVFPHLIEPVYHYEGTLARLMGDAVLAFFGAPLAHEDDPQRAVLAGLEIVERMRRHREHLAGKVEIDLDVRVGINTGLVVVGEVGSDLRVEYTAMGDAINLAARMEQTARPGTVQIAADTYRLVGPLFDVEPLGDVDVKGKRKSVAAYRVVGRSARPEPRRAVERRDRPLIGRDGESAVLSQAVAALQSGRGAIVCLIGEAGLGKTRLITEQRSAWTGHPSRWLDCRAASYDAGRAYGQFRQLTSRLLEVAEGDPPGSIRTRIRDALAFAPPDRRAAWVEAFEALLGIESLEEARPGDGRTSSPSSARQAGRALGGEALKGALFDASAALWRRWAAAPAVVVLDDLHWGDAASIALLRHLFALVGELPLLIVCAFRPDRRAPSWQIRRGVAARLGVPYRQIALRPLSADASERLVDALLDGTEQPPSAARANNGPYRGQPAVPRGGRAGVA